MNVGELFVKLGVKGDGSAKKALLGTHEGLKDIRSMSLEAKAAILGVVYGLQRMMSSSLKGGQDLANFASLTGMSTDKLQRYQYAASLVGMKNEEMTSTFVGLQKAISGLDLEGEGLQSLGGISQFLARAGETLDIQRFKTDIPYAIQMLQKFKQLDNSFFGGQVNPEGFKNLLLSKVGVSDSLSAAFGRNAFSESILNSAPVKSEGQIKALANMEAQWVKIMTKIDRLVDSLIVQFGPEIMKQIEQIIPVMIDLVKKIAELIIELRVGKNVRTGYDALKNPEKIIKNIQSAGFEGTVDALKKTFNIGGLKKTEDAMWKSTAENARMLILRKAQDEYESKYGSSRKPNSSAETIIEEQVNKNESNFYFDIKSIDPKEAAREIKAVTQTLNLIPTKSYGA